MALVACVVFVMGKLEKEQFGLYGRESRLDSRKIPKLIGNVFYS